jgi:hypothetical protein
MCPAVGPKGMCNGNRNSNRKNKQRQKPMQGSLHCLFGYAQGPVEMTDVWVGEKQIPPLCCGMTARKARARATAQG